MLPLGPRLLPLALLAAPLLIWGGIAGWSACEEYAQARARARYLEKSREQGRQAARRDLRLGRPAPVREFRWDALPDIWVDRQTGIAFHAVGPPMCGTGYDETVAHREGYEQVLAQAARDGTLADTGFLARLPLLESLRDPDVGRDWPAVDPASGAALESQDGTPIAIVPQDGGATDWFVVEVPQPGGAPPLRVRGIQGALRATIADDGKTLLVRAEPGGRWAFDVATGRTLGSFAP